MAALESVDYVTWFSEDTPREIIVKLKPGIMVKGGDYKVSEMLGAKEIKAWGGHASDFALRGGQEHDGDPKKSR